MKLINKTAYLFLILITALVLSGPVFPALYENVTPTQPPRVPVTDYGEGSHGIVDFLFMRYSFEIVDFLGLGFGYNYVDNFENTDTAYNLGAGFLYLTGSATYESTNIDAYNWNLPLNANLGYRVLGTKDTNNLMIFGGIHWTYTWLVVDIDYGVHDVYLYGPAYGPLFGAKGQIVVNRDVTIIPFYVFHHAIFDYSLEYDGIPIDADIDPVTSHFFGFDIKFGSISVGALFDMINNTDNDKITIMVTYDFDYSSSSAPAQDINVKKDTKKENKRVKKTK